LPNLVLCSGCHRHFRAHDAVCPFCGVSVAAAVAPRVVAGLVPGASRSRRYAVSAAFLAGSAVFACGETSNDGGSAQNSAGSGGEQTQVTTGGASSGQGGSKSNQGGTAAGGGASAGGSGGATGGATLSTGGRTQGTGGASVNGGASAGGADTKATGRACEGYDDRSGCHTADQCTPQQGAVGSVSCVLALPTAPCGNPMFLPQCPAEGCADGQVCVQGTCGSSCFGACTETSCAAGSECVDGQCQLLPCSETQVPCPDGYECDFDATGPGNHCVASRCESGDYECEPWQDCAQRPGVDAHGCVAHQCTADADCETCGYCVESQCAPQLGICYQMIAMPYGCVWPDEELI
jgi:hypothetical protein